MKALKICVVLLLVAAATGLSAQPGGSPLGTKPTPIDGGITILAGVGVLYGYQLRKKFRETGKQRGNRR